MSWADKFVNAVDRHIGKDQGVIKQSYPENRILNHEFYGRSYKIRGITGYSKIKYKYELKGETYEIPYVSAQFYLGVKIIEVDYHLAWESKLYPIAEDAFNVLIAESNRLESLVPKRIEVVKEDKALDTTDRDDIKMILNKDDKDYWLVASNLPPDNF
jgi:hypothetical protein